MGEELGVGWRGVRRRVKEEVDCRGLGQTPTVPHYMELK